MCSSWGSLLAGVICCWLREYVALPALGAGGGMLLYELLPDDETCAAWG